MRSGRPSFSEIQRERAEIRDHITAVVGPNHEGTADRLSWWLHRRDVRGDPREALMALTSPYPNGIGRQTIKTIERYEAIVQAPRDDRDLVIEFLRAPLGRTINVLAGYLRRIHDGTDRGELKALLVEAWGASPGAPPLASDFRGIGKARDLRPSDFGPSDLRGLAAREAGRDVCIDPEKMHGYCDQFGGSDY